MLRKDSDRLHKEDEEELEYEKRYNEGVFDMDAIKKIELENIKKLNPFRKEVRDKE